MGVIFVYINKEYREGIVLQCYMEFSRSALVHNAESIIKYVGCPVIGMVKLNGYGLSVTEAARIWLDAGATMLGVSRPDEALSLRRDGIEADILLTAPVADTAALNSLLMERIILTVTSWENAVFYAKNCALSRFPVHIALDTGMGRFGLRWDDIEGIKAVYSMERLIVEGIFSHFSAAFGADFSSVQTQLERFTQITDRLSADGYSVGMRHIANTAAALRIYRHWRRPSFRERVFACCASARTCAVQRAWKSSGISGASWAIAASSLSS
jgi:alanine racemase